MVNFGIINFLVDCFFIFVNGGCVDMVVVDFNCGFDCLLGYGGWGLEGFVINCWNGDFVGKGVGIC